MLLGYFSEFSSEAHYYEDMTRNQKRIGKTESGRSVREESYRNIKLEVTKIESSYAK